MLIRLFVYSNDDADAEILCEKILEPLQECIVSKKLTKNERYWKLKHMFQVEFELELNLEVNDISFIKFLNSIADKWEVYGDPVNEILISEKMPGCKLIRDKVSLISIFV